MSAETFPQRLAAVETLVERYRSAASAVTGCEVGDPRVRELKATADRLDAELDVAVRDVVHDWWLLVDAGHDDAELYADRVRALPRFEKCLSWAKADASTRGPAPIPGLDCDHDDGWDREPPEDAYEDLDKGDRKASQATLLVELAEELFDLGVTDTGEPFAVRRDGPRLALQLRGGRTSLRATLASEFYNAHCKAPSASALADALAVIEGRAADADPVELPLRVAVHDGAVVVDLGGPDGRAVVVSPAGWEVVDRSPVLFRRTNLTLPLPVPSDAGDADPVLFLRDLNAGEHQLRLLVGWLVAALLPEIPHPVLALFGEQGTGKSTAGRIIGETVDPTAAPLRSAPRHEDQWQVAASGSWAVVLDNLSAVQPWLSDALCRAVTGDGAVKRQLYTDSDVSVLRFRRCVVMTSIDAGALRGDLAERLLPIELERIDATERRTEADIVERFHDQHPQLLASLFALLARVLDVLPTVELDELPRMADFARVLAALDAVTGWSTLPAFMGVGETLAEDVIDADPVAQAVVALVDRDGSWTGSTSMLLRELTDPEARLPKDWPTTPNVLSGRLKRCATALRAVGVIAEQGHGRDRRTWHLEKAGEGPSPSSPPSQASRRNGSRVTTTDTGDDRDGHGDDHQQLTVTPEPAPAQRCDDGDDRDGLLHPLSERH